MAGMGQGRGSRQLWGPCESTRVSTAADVSSLRLPSPLHPPVDVLSATGCRMRGRSPVLSRLACLWLCPGPSMRSGCTVLSSHRRCAPRSSVTSVQGPAIPLHRLRLAVPDPRGSGPGPWRDAFPKLLRSQLPWPFVSVHLMPWRGLATVGHVVHPCKWQPWVPCLSKGSGLQRLRFWLGRRSGNGLAGAHRLLWAQGCLSALQV